MKVLFDESNSNYCVTDMSYDDIIELRNALLSCPLPQRRIFHNLKSDMEKIIEGKKKRELIVIKS